ncbi:Inositol-pentakisphosphate 2-kinase [Citrus sinensis]|nr:Inositol-pentakisphosphate 2-kinase [Citrus sinensis]
MDVVLDQNDAADWIYRGEGAANLVLAYAGSSPAFVGKVLRIPKAWRNGKPEESLAQCVNGGSVFGKHEQLLWGDNQELLSSSSKETMEQMYVEKIMSPLLGPKYIDAGMCVRVTREFLESVQKNVTGQRPAWRVDAADIKIPCDSVLLMSDHTLFPQGILGEEPCLAVEIKISERSEYDPLDLFSGSKERICKAIKALYTNPQNNLRVFLNGSLIFGSLGGGMCGNSFAFGEAFEDALKCTIKADNGLRTDSFIQLVAETVHQAGILDRLLEVQKLDNFDIEGAIHAYYNIISQPCRAYFVDLDLKPFKKMEEHYAKDKKISSCYIQMLKSR